MLVTSLVFAANLQARILKADFIVESVDSAGFAQEIARSSWSNLLDVNGNSVVSWRYETNGNKSGWRRDYEYDPKGEVKFHAYETWFGELKNRWILAREDGEWKMRGPSTRMVPDRKSRFHDESMTWFTLKKVKVGEKAKISAIDSGTFLARKGEALYARDVQLVINRKTVTAHIVQKSWDDELQIWYFDPDGTPLRIEQAFPRAGLNFTFKLEK